MGNEIPKRHLQWLGGRSELGLHIAGILPYVGDKKKRSLFIRSAWIKMGQSGHCKNYLRVYLVYQDMVALAHQRRKQRSGS